MSNEAVLANQVGPQDDSPTSRMSCRKVVPFGLAHVEFEWLSLHVAAGTWPDCDCHFSALVRCLGLTAEGASCENILIQKTSSAVTDQEVSSDEWVGDLAQRMGRWRVRVERQSRTKRTKSVADVIAKTPLTGGPTSRCAYAQTTLPATRAHRPHSHCMCAQTTRQSVRGLTTSSAIANSATPNKKMPHIAATIQ